MSKNKTTIIKCNKCDELIEVSRVFLKEPNVMCYDCSMDKAGY